MTDASRMYRVTIVAPTCLYYQETLFRELSAHRRIDLTVYFCSDEAIRAKDILKLYRTEDQWGIEDELLKGYKYEFLRNFSPRPSYLSWPFGLINLGIWNKIKDAKPDVVIVMGWTNITWWVTLLASRYFRVPFLYMNDANVQAENAQPMWKSLIKKVLLGRVYFKLAAGFLSSGTSNDILYEYYGVSRDKIVPFAYSMVHHTFLPVAEELGPQKNRLRAELDIPEDSFVILYCGRFVKQKGALDLLEAYRQVGLPNTVLILVGDGEFRQPLADFVARHNLDSVRFYGFQDRKAIGKFYAVSDILVLPSWRETWGMVVNEALCFGLPVVVSDQVGARDDLVHEGYNGFTFPVGNPTALASSIERLMDMPKAERLTMGANSLGLIKEWSKKDVPGSLVRYLDIIQADADHQSRRGIPEETRDKSPGL